MYDLTEWSSQWWLKQTNQGVISLRSLGKPWQWRQLIWLFLESYPQGGYLANDPAIGSAISQVLRVFSYQLPQWNQENTNHYVKRGYVEIIWFYLKQMKRDAEIIWWTQSNGVKASKVVAEPYGGLRSPWESCTQAFMMNTTLTTHSCFLCLM